MKANETPVRILLVDDHGMFRAGVRTLIQRDMESALITECESSEQALRAISQHRPDVALLDISLKGEDGIELAHRITTEHGDSVRCIMLSMHVNPEYVMRSFGAGARGYVVKDAGPEELTLAIRTVMTGQRYVSPSATGSLVDGLSRKDTSAAHFALSPRQLEVLRLVALGKSTKVIARELELSTKTVDAHRYQISQRLNVHDVAGMVRYAIRHGLVANEP